MASKKSAKEDNSRGSYKKVDDKVNTVSKALKNPKASFRGSPPEKCHNMEKDPDKRRVDVPVKGFSLKKK